MNGVINVLFHGRVLGMYYGPAPGKVNYPCIPFKGDGCCADSTDVCMTCTYTLYSDDCVVSLRHMLFHAYPQLQSYDTALSFAHSIYPELQI